MNEIAETRIIEINNGEWVVQFSAFNGWTTMGDVFESREEAQLFLDEQIDSADIDD